MLGTAECVHKPVSMLFFLYPLLSVCVCVSDSLCVVLSVWFMGVQVHIALFHHRNLSQNQGTLLQELDLHFEAGAAEGVSICAKYNCCETIRK